MVGSTALFLDMLATDVDTSDTTSLVARARAGDVAAFGELVAEHEQDTTRYVQTGIETDIDLREGQKAVIGKTSIEGSAETVFVVVTGTISE